MMLIRLFLFKKVIWIKKKMQLGIMTMTEIELLIMLFSYY